jgi:outer membrane protein assembly factor BamB
VLAILKWSGALAAGILVSGACWAAEGHPFVRGASSEDAVAYQLNVAHTGSTTFSGGFSTPLKQIWSVNVGDGLSYAVIADGAVIVVGDDNFVTALDVTTGKKRWSRALSNLSSNVGPAYENGLVFVQNTSDLLTALYTKNGKTKWVTQLPLQPGSDTSPMAVNGQVFAVGNGEAGYFYDVNETDGRVQWYKLVENGFFSSPAFDGTGVIVTYPCRYYKFDPATGNVVWHYYGAVEGGGGSTPVYFQKNVYIEDDIGCGDIIGNSKNGFFKGAFPKGGMGPWGNPTLFKASNGLPVGISSDPYHLTAWNGRTGKVLWTFGTDHLLQTYPIVVNGTIIEGSNTNILYFVNEKGKQIWSTTVPSNISSVAAGEGTLIVVGGTTVTALVPQ